MNYSLVSMNHWNNDEKKQKKTNRCHLHTKRSLRLIMLGKDHLHIIEKGAQYRIEPCGIPYFNIQASEKYFQYKPKTFCLKDRTQTI